MKIKNILLMTIISLTLSACSHMISPGMHEELQQGKITFAKGDYQKAFHQLLPVAVYGNKEAQYAVGYMYYNGIGVAQDTDTGMVWMKKSAEQNYAPAVKAMQALKG